MKCPWAVGMYCLSNWLQSPKIIIIIKKKRNRSVRSYRIHNRCRVVFGVFTLWYFAVDYDQSLTTCKRCQISNLLCWREQLATIEHIRLRIACTLTRIHAANSYLAIWVAHAHRAHTDAYTCDTSNYRFQSVTAKRCEFHAIFMHVAHSPVAGRCRGA